MLVGGIPLVSSGRAPWSCHQVGVHREHRLLAAVATVGFHSGRVMHPLPPRGIIYIAETDARMRLWVPFPAAKRMLTRLRVWLTLFLS